MGLVQEEERHADLLSTSFKNIRLSNNILKIWLQFKMATEEDPELPSPHRRTESTAA